MSGSRVLAREGDIQLSLMIAREIASPAYPFDENAAREWIEREVDSGPRDTTFPHRYGRPSPTRSASSPTGQMLPRAELRPASAPVSGDRTGQAPGQNARR